jgi:hypothetical protein
VNNNRSIFYETFSVLVANRRIDLPHLLAKATLVIRAFPERLSVFVGQSLYLVEVNNGEIDSHSCYKDDSGEHPTK